MKQDQRITMEDIYLAIMEDDDATPALEYPIKGKLVGLDPFQLSQSEEDRLDETIMEMMERVDTVTYLNKVLNWSQ